MRLDRKFWQKEALAIVPSTPELLAGIAATQAASRTAMAHTHHQVARSVEHSRPLAIATLLEAKPGWRAAAIALGGSFHPGVAPMIDAKML